MIGTDRMIDKGDETLGKLFAFGQQILHFEILITKYL